MRRFHSLRATTDGTTSTAVFRILDAGVAKGPGCAQIRRVATSGRDCLVVRLDSDCLCDGNIDCHMGARRPTDAGVSEAPKHRASAGAAGIDDTESWRISAATHQRCTDGTERAEAPVSTASRLPGLGSLTVAAFDLAPTAALRGDATEQPPEQVLEAAGTEFGQRHLDRPPAAQHVAAGGRGEASWEQGRSRSRADPLAGPCFSHRPSAPAAV